MPFKNKQREKFIRRINRISKLGFYLNSDVSKIESDIELLNKRIGEIRKQLNADVTFADSGLSLIRKFKK